MIIREIDFFRLESSVWIAEKKTRIPAYDFQFEPLFRTDRPSNVQKVPTIARIGAIADYEKTYRALLAFDFELINTPAQHQLASDLASWYPLIKDLTPRSKVYQTFPALLQAQQDIGFPMFIKGSRQTAKHNPALSIAHNEEEFLYIQQAYQADPILHWQKVVCRELIPLKRMTHQVADKVPISFEFRTFWWNSRLVGEGHYWSQYLDYRWTDTERATALRIAEVVTKRLEIPFLVIDLAMTASGQWIIIECNDAQESGYCGVQPMKMWRNIIQEK